MAERNRKSNGNTRGAAREERKRLKLMESAVGAIALGIAMLVAPAMLSSPMFKGLGATLKTPAFLAIGAGIIMLALSRLSRPRRAGDEPVVSELGVNRAPAPGRQRGRMGSGSESGEYVPEPEVLSKILGKGDLAAKVVPPAPHADTQPSTYVKAAESTPAPTVPNAPSQWGPAVFDVIEWRRFEAVCEWLFGQAGFETKTQSHGADGGIDIWLFSKNHPEGPVSVVQCKHWKSRPVKVAEVRALLGSMTDKKVPRGIFATTSTFSADARELAANNKIQLLDRNGLLDLIAKRTPEQQRELLDVATKGEYWIPTCASCGIKMVRRSKKGEEHSGNGFWGCVNFPRCRTTINI